ncbi:hypothetical protein NCCP2716_00380 [Sporosarcina sp. NCCP-2716]|nr:hypothetical protein NCCP2716_00380 [Sporosarcina sp. NCCP-2716]
MIRARAAAERNTRTATAKSKRREPELFGGTIMMELSEVRNELDKTAKKLAGFRGSL